MIRAATRHDQRDADRETDQDEREVALRGRAIAITLSRLMTMSATAMIRTARHRCSAALYLSSSGSSGTRSLAAI